MNADREDRSHRCTDRECPSFRQCTGNSCLCHRTDAQMMQAAIDALRQSLADALGRQVEMDRAA